MTVKHKPRHRPTIPDDQYSAARTAGARIGITAGEYILRALRGALSADIALSEDPVATARNFAPPHHSIHKMTDDDALTEARRWIADPTFQPGYARTGLELAFLQSGISAEDPDLHPE